MKIARKNAAPGSAARLRAEVKKLREELRRARSLATLGTMTAMIAHEVNNILTPIVNYAQLARNNPDLLPKAVAHAADGGKRAHLICEAILGMTRRGPDAPEEVPLRSLVEQTIVAMAREPKRDAIEIVVNVDDDLVLSGRRVELQQVLLNLLLNARQAVLARSAPRRIEVTAESDGLSIHLRVRDNGPGIPQKHLSKIFEPFFTTRPSGGSGLGLAFCRHIVRSQGGKIAVHSREGDGATFTVTLPLNGLPAATAAAG